MSRSLPHRLPRRLSMAPARSTPGFTIVEFLVAVGIGLVVSVLIGQIFVGSKQSFNSQDDLARVQENMRFASQVLTRTVRMAGYRTNSSVDPNTIFLKTTTPAITGVNDTAVSGFVAGSDSLAVRYQGTGTGAGTGNGTGQGVGCSPSVSPCSADGAVVDCIGQAIDFGLMTTSTFAVRTVPGGASLSCSVDGGTTWNELVSDVQDMQLLYGVDTDNDGSANFYVPFNAVSDVDQIVSIRAWLLVRSPSLTGAVIDTKTYNLAGKSLGPYNDRYVRRILYSTINLRNRTL